MSQTRSTNQIYLDWQGTRGGYFCDFRGQEWKQLIPDELFGVYIIWEMLGVGDFTSIKVGQGNIKERLMSHRSDKKIVGDGSKLSLLTVSWAEVSKKDVDGVEGYLGHLLSPRMGERFPDVDQIAVNLPLNGIVKRR